MTASINRSDSLPTVQIYRAGQAREIRPACGAILNALQTIAHVPSRLPDDALQVFAAPIPLYWETEVVGGSGLACGAGLEPAVRMLLEREGYRIETVGRSRAPLPHPEQALLQPFDVLDGALLDWVRRHERGLIRYAAEQVDPIHLLAQIALAWPNQKIAVVVTRIDEGRQIRDRLRDYGIAAMAVNSSNQPPEVGSVAVCTPAGLSHLPVQVAWLDMLIALHAQDMTSKSGMEYIGYAERARLFGLLEHQERPAPLERDFMTSLFGFHVITIPRHGHRERSVQVLRYPIRGGARLPAKLDVLTAKRRGLWHHALRNRKVAQIARALREGGADKLLQLLPEIESLPRASFASGVLVLVENVEHALVLSRRLPGWPVFTGHHVCREGFNEQEKDLLRPPSPFGEDNPLYAIVTAAGIGALDLTPIGVLVRADGGVGLPALSEQDLIESATAAPRPLLLIDLHDRHHPILRRWSRWRQEAYAERGWFAPGVDPVQARVEHFLAIRSKEKRR